MCSRTSDYRAACIDRKQEKSQMVIRSIGDGSLYIDGFVYVKNGQEDSGLVHWKCVRSHQRWDNETICEARIVTTHSASSGETILHGDWGNSKHNHAPSLADREEAEALEEFCKKMLQNPDESHADDKIDSDSETHSEREISTSESSGTIGEIESEDAVASTESNQLVQSSASIMASSVIDPNNAVASMPSRVIDKRLNLNGFSYSRCGANRDLSKIYWQCKQYHARRCLATAITSNPRDVRGLIVYKGPHESKHNHSAIDADGGGAVKVVRSRFKKKKLQSKLVSQSVLRRIPTIEKTLATNETTCKLPDKNEKIDKNKYSDAESDSNNESATDIELQDSELSKAVEEMNVDEIIFGTESNKLARTRARSGTDRKSRVTVAKNSRVGKGRAYKPGNGKPKMFECPFCDKCFEQKWGYLQHERIHTDNRPYGCSECGKRFRQQSHLLHHSRIHTNEKPYTCLLCEQTFRQHAILSQHLRIHSGEKPYHCAECGRNFRQKSSLDKHVCTPQDFSNKTSTDIESRNSESPRTVEEMDADEEVLETESNTLACTDGPRMSRESPLINSDVRNVINPDLSAPRLIGHRLYIGGYIYTRNCKSSIDGRIHWECKRYRNKGCPGRAITSDPFLGEKLKLYRGPDVSRHDHLSSQHEVEEAEKVAKFGSKRGRKPKIAHQIVSWTSRKKDRPLINRSPSPQKPEKAEKSINLERQTRVSRSTSQMEPSSPGPKESEHYHPPSLDEVRAAEEFANSGITKRPSKSQATNQTCNGRSLTQDRLSLRQIRQPHPKRSSANESESNGSTLSQKRRNASVSNQCNRTKRKGTRRSLLSDPSTYRIFLTRFLDNPIFNKENIIRALRFVYRSDIGCIVAYVTVSENRRKIERDLETLKKDPNASISALDDMSPIFTRGEDVPENIDSEEVGMEKAKTVPSNHSSSFAEQCHIVTEKDVSEEKRHSREHLTPSRSDEETISTENLESPERVPSDGGYPYEANGVHKISETTPTPTSASLDENQSLSHSDSSNAYFSGLQFQIGTEIGGTPFSQQMTNKEETSQRISPPSAVLPEGNQLLSRPCISVIDSSEEVLKVNQETEDHPSLQKNMNDGTTSETIPPVPAALPIKDFFAAPSSVSTEDLSRFKPEVKREVTFIDLTDDTEIEEKYSAQEVQMIYESGPAFSSSNTSSASLALESNRIQTMYSTHQSYPCGANPIISNVQIQSQNQFISLNPQGVWCDSNMHQILSYVSANSTVNTPCLMGNVQVPLLMDVTRMRNDVVSNAGQLYAQIQVFRQPGSYRQNQGP